MRMTAAKATTGVGDSSLPRDSEKRSASSASPAGATSLVVRGTRGYSLDDFDTVATVGE